MENLYCFNRMLFKWDIGCKSYNSPAILCYLVEELVTCNIHIDW